MTKSLTEKCEYEHIECNISEWEKPLTKEFVFCFNDGKKAVFKADKDVHTMQQFLDRMNKVHELEQKLAIATKALKNYADEENWRTATTIINTDYFEYECSMYGLKDKGFEEAQKALKEMEGVK